MRSLAETVQHLLQAVLKAVGWQCFDAFIKTLQLNSNHDRFAGKVRRLDQKTTQLITKASPCCHQTPMPACHPTLPANTGEDLIRSEDDTPSGSVVVTCHDGLQPIQHTSPSGHG